MLRSYSYDSNRIKKRNSVTCGERKSDSKLTRSRRMIGGKVANRKVSIYKALLFIASFLEAKNIFNSNFSPGHGK